MRPEWPLPTDKILRAHIRNHHRISIDECLERYKFIWREFGPPVEMLFGGGIQAYLALEELRLCYMDGYYLAVVLLAQIFIESSLGGEYIISGDDNIAEAGFAKLINRALSDSMIDSTLVAKFHELRRMRNPYVHPKGGTGSGTLMGRVLDKYKNGEVFQSPVEMAKVDAEQAIRTVVDFLRYSSRQGGHLWEPPPGIDTNENDD